MKHSSQSTPLLAHDPTAIPLYDPQAMVLMDKSVAQGYITFLSWGEPNNINKADVDDTGFLAITQGNVLEGCFGVCQITALRAKPDSAAARSASRVRRLKLLLAEAAEADSRVALLAVATYLKAFEIVLRTCDEVDQLNCLTKCFFYRAVITKAQVDLQNCFAKLQEAVQQQGAAAAAR